MTQTAKLLDAVAKNAQTGAIAIEDLLPKTQDEQMRSELRSQHEQFVAVHRSAEKMLEACGETAPDPSLMTKMGMWMGTQFNTALDRSGAHLADIMIEGLTMGVIDTTKARNDNPDANAEAQGIAASFITQQQDSIDRMKRFLT